MLRAWLPPAILGAFLLTLTAGASAAPEKAAPQKAKPTVNAGAAVMSDFLKRVDGYVAVHKKAEDTLPPLAKQTDPQLMDAHERALAKLIQTARRTAKQGEILTPAMQRRIRTLLRPIFAGKAGQQIRSEILDKEYKGNATLAVSARYPDEVPVSTVPPQVLEGLPKLPEELEYRFIGSSLILFDSHAHIIADYMDRAFT